MWSSDLEEVAIIKDLQNLEICSLSLLLFLAWRVVCWARWANHSAGWQVEAEAVGDDSAIPADVPAGQPFRVHPGYTQEKLQIWRTPAGAEVPLLCGGYGGRQYNPQGVLCRPERTPPRWWRRWTTRRRASSSCWWRRSRLRNPAGRIGRFVVGRGHASFVAMFTMISEIANVLLRRP